MKRKLVLLAFGILTLGPLAPLSRAQEGESFDLEHDIRDRTDRFTKLSVEEQLKFRAAQVKAAADPAVRSALEKRNAAIRAFRAAMRESMLKADPEVAPILSKIAESAGRPNRQ